MLSFEKTKKSIPVAICRGGEKHGERVFLTPDVPTKCPPLETENGEFVPLPRVDIERDIVYISGASGSGKSHFARNYCENYNRVFPDRPIYLISELTEDETLDNSKVKLFRLPIASLMAKPAEITEFENSLVVFDDTDAVSKEVSKMVETLMNKLLTMGRHTKTSLIIICHNATNYGKSRLLLNESMRYVVFPHSTSQVGLKRLLSTYLGLGAKEIEELKKLPSRWLYLSKTYPPYYITENKMGMLFK